MEKKVNKKYTFALISLVFQALSLIWVRYLGFTEKNEMVALICTQVSLLVIAVTYLTGQAKIDIAASATYGKKDVLPPIPGTGFIPPHIPGIG